MVFQYGVSSFSGTLFPGWLGQAQAKAVPFFRLVSTNKRQKPPVAGGYPPTKGAEPQSARVCGSASSRRPRAATHLGLHRFPETPWRCGRNPLAGDFLQGVGLRGNKHLKPCLPSKRAGRKWEEKGTFVALQEGLKKRNLPYSPTGPGDRARRQKKEALLPSKHQ